MLQKALTRQQNLTRKAGEMLAEGKNGAYEPPLYQRQLWLFILACSIREGVC
jgi:hypothetical protein